MRWAPVIPAMLACGPTFAHDGSTAAFDRPGWALAALLPIAACHGIGWTRLWRRSAAGRRILVARAALFACGWLVTAFALAGPMARLDGRSFAAHMVEHGLLLLVAAPLFAMARPGPVFLWAFPSGMARVLSRPLRWRVSGAMARATDDPVAASLLFAIVLWSWHAPRSFDAALASPGWHVVQHASFLGVGILFWRATIPPPRDRRTCGVAAFCQFATACHGALLGTLMLFATRPWYDAYARALPAADLSPLEDQQLAGLLMWVPGGIVHACAALALVALWLGAGGRRDGEGRFDAARV